MTTNPQPRYLTPAETAGCLIVMLQRQGAVFAIDRDGVLNVNVDAVPFPQGDCSPDDLAQVIFALREEITTILATDRTRH